MTKTRRIAIVGGNGQVGSEVALILARAEGVESRPISRTRLGSAFLRYAGVPVLHGSIADAGQARTLMAGADVVANFALAIGTPGFAIKENASIIESTVAHSPPTARIVFFSTMAVYEPDAPKNPLRLRGSYANLKLDNEHRVLDAARKHGRQAHILRLGHVAGAFQNISQAMREELASSVVRLPDPERASNVTHTATIAEALLAIAEGRAGPADVYDLPDFPQWSWRQVYEHEARQIGVVPRFEVVAAPAAVSRFDAMRSAKRLAMGVAGNPGLRALGERALTFAPVKWNDFAKAKIQADRAARELAAIVPAPVVVNGAAAWPAFEPKVLSGLRETRAIIDLPEFAATTELGPRWPQDLA